MVRGGLWEVDGAEIVCLVDNVVDPLLMGTETVRRPRIRGEDLPTELAPFMGPGIIPKTLRAEHGFSALIYFCRGDERHAILLDSGVSPGGLTHNLALLRIDLQSIDAVVLSHGHADHAGGLGSLAEKLGERGVPLFAHPDAWLARRVAVPNRGPIEIPAANREMLAGAGFRVQETARPALLFSDSLLVSGEIERSTAFETGFPFHETYRDGQWLPDTWIRDDQAVVLNLRGKGLVIVTGCGHAGVVNILRHVTQHSGIDRVHALIGGFHLNGPAFEGRLKPTLDAVKEFAPRLLVPMHCTGWKAAHAFAATMPDSFVQNCVGTAYTL